MFSTRDIWVQWLSKSLVFRFGNSQYARARNARVSGSKDLVNKAQEVAKRQDSGVYGEDVAGHALMAEESCNT